MTNKIDKIQMPDGQVLKLNGGSGLEVGDISMALYVDETKGLRRYLNGQIIDINTNTQAFLNRLLEIKNTNPDYFTTEDNWQSEALLNIDGCVYKFVLNYSGANVVSVRLPKYPDYVEINAGGTLPVVGNGLTLGLTDGTAQFGVKNFPKYYLASGSSNVNVGTASSNIGPIQDSAIGVTTDPTKSGIQTTLKQTKLKMRYFIQIATGSETENNIINEIELNNPFSLFDSKYSDHELNNLSWLKSEGQWNTKAVYPSAYDELLREYNNPDRLATFNRDAFTVVGSPTITDDGVASGFSSSNYITAPIPTELVGNPTKWTMTTKFHFDYVPSTTSIQCIFCNEKQNSSTGLLSYVSNSVNSTSSVRIILFNSSNEIVLNTETAYKSNVMKKNTTYFVKAEYDNLHFVYSISEDGKNWTNLYNNNISEAPYFESECNITIGTRTRGLSNYILNSIDLKHFSITVDGVKVLSGAKSMVKLSTETYTDYDFVLNTAEETFRLPLKNHTADDGKSVLTLYFYVGETVQNANLIDAGRIGEQLATKTDMLQASGAGMPSNKYIDLTLGASGSTYTAPANGYFYAHGNFGNVNGYFTLTNSSFTTFSIANSGTYACDCTISCKKGDVVTASYNYSPFSSTGSGTPFFRFIYAEGSK